MGHSRRWVSWNVRGLGSAEKRRAVVEAIRIGKFELVLFQETKLGDNKARVGELLAKSLNSSILLRERVAWCVPASLTALMAEWDFLRFLSDKTLWSLIPYAMVWSLWLSRNDSCFNQKQFSATEVWDAHILKIGWWALPLLQTCSYSIDQLSRNFESIRFPAWPQKIRTAVWVPPVAGLIKIIVVGAARGSPGICGIGGVHFNSLNEVVGFFSKNIGEGFAFEAEVKAVHEALLFCVSRNLRNLVLESVSSLAVGWVNNHSNRPWKLLNLLNQIDCWVVEVNCLKVSHIFREANTSADRLAKRGAAFTKELVYFNSSIVM